MPSGLVWGDAPELAAAAWSLGVPHPTGYPLYLIITHGFQWLPLGTIAFRSHLLSALLTGISCSLLYLLIRDALNCVYCKAQPPLNLPQLGGDLTVTQKIRQYFTYSVFPALLAVLAFRLTPIIWQQANVTEVYPLMMLLFVGTLWVIPKAVENPSKYIPLFALLIGLQLIHHRLAVFLIALSVLFLLWNLRRQFNQIPITRSLLGLCIPLLLLLYFPFRAWFDPPINWFDPDDWHGFLQLVSGGQFRVILQQGIALFAQQARFGFIIHYLLLPLYGYSIAFLLCLVGFAILLWRRWDFGMFVLLTYGSYQAFFMLYPVGDRESFLMPALVLASIPFGFSVSEILFQMRNNELKPVVVGLVGFALLAGSITPFGISTENLIGRIPGMSQTNDVAPTLFPQWKSAWVDRTHSAFDTSATDYANDVWRNVPKGAPIVTGLYELTADNELHPLLYQQIVERRQPDSALVGAGFLLYDWYRQQLNKTINLGLEMRGDQPSASRDAWLEDTWNTVVAPMLERGPVYSTSYPLPHTWSPKAKIQIVQQFDVDTSYVPPSYAYHLPKGYVLKISSESDTNNQSND